jgi:tetratricopeptide (TPR) repeat protein
MSLGLELGGAAHYAKAGESIGTSLIAMVTHPGEQPIPMEAYMRLSHSSVILVLSLFAPWTAFGAGGGPSVPSAGPSMEARQPPSPEEQARTAYNQGVRSVEKADELMADAARQAEDRKQEKLRKKANDAYAGAVKKFVRATELRPGMYEAWNYLGYSNRKLGHYDLALAAYDRALTLKPGYAEAIEYRGHAYLGLNRLAEAKEAYLTLFASHRNLAASLLNAMQQWVGEHRGNAGNLDPGSVDAFASWVSERGTIASQTAALTREGASAAWR